MLRSRIIVSCTLQRLQGGPVAEIRSLDDSSLADRIISHAEMSVREANILKKGMNFGVSGNHSVILMSVRPNAPYRDRLDDGGSVLIYEGHDVARTRDALNPKLIDQPERYPGGSLTENGKFHSAAQQAKLGATPERVRVYEKIKPGIWAYNGVFHLVDSWVERDEHRKVFKFRLVAVKGDEDFTRPPARVTEKRRIIPAAVKRASTASAARTRPTSRCPTAIGSRSSRAA